MDNKGSLKRIRIDGEFTDINKEDDEFYYTDENEIPKFKTKIHRDGYIIYNSRSLIKRILNWIKEEFNG